MQQSEDNECHVLEFVLRCTEINEFDHYYDQFKRENIRLVANSRHAPQMPPYNPHVQSNHSFPQVENGQNYINPYRVVIENPSMQNHVPTQVSHEINYHTSPMMHYDETSYNNSYTNESHVLPPYETYETSRPIDPSYQINSGPSFGVSAHLESTHQGAFICVHVPQGIYLFPHSLNYVSDQNTLFHSGTVNAYPTRYLWVNERVQDHTNNLPTEQFYNNGESHYNNEEPHYNNGESHYNNNNQVNDYSYTNYPNEPFNERNQTIEEMFSSASFFDLTDEEFTDSEDDFDTDTEQEQSPHSIDDILLEIYIFPGQTFDDIKKCAICLEEFFSNDEIRILPCRHDFHLTCVNRWLTLNRSCPVCRANF